MKCRLMQLSHLQAVKWVARLEKNQPGIWGPRWCYQCGAYHVRRRFQRVFTGYPVVKREVMTSGAFEEMIDHLDGSHCIDHCPCGGQGGIVVVVVLTKVSQDPI